jgi:prolyl oligopeptidase
MDLTDSSLETLAWQADHDAGAAAHLASLPGQAELQRRVAERLTDTRQAPLTGRGGRWFQQLVLDPSAEQAVLVVRDRPDGQPRVLVDPNAMTVDRDTPVTVLSASPSPDGRTVACTVMEAGTERFELLLVDVDSGGPVDHPVTGAVSSVTWLPDSSGFWCSTREVVDGELRCFLHRQVLGAPPAPPLLVPGSLTDAAVLVSEDGEHAAVRTGNTEQRLDWAIRGGELTPLLRELPGGFAGAFDGDDLVVITDDGAPRGRLVRIPVATAGDPSTWTELLAESEDVLRAVAVVGDAIVLGHLRDAACHLRLLDRSGAVLDEIELVGDGTIGAHPVGASHPALPMFTIGDGEISFIRSTFGSSWAVYRYVIAERRLELVTPPAIEVDGLVVTTVSAVSSDGASVPAHVVHRADLDVSVPQPTLLHGYGGFNLAYLPAFSAPWAAWVESGGILVVAHLRGGSELGSTWWQQGRRATKQLTFDDLYALAEELISSGRTTADQLAVEGSSNGGLLAGAAIVQRPELWAAVACDVPILDLLGYERDPLTYAIGREEYGDPRIPEEAEWLRAISPVHNVEPSAFPAVLVTAGANDPRCPVWHARAFVGLLEQADTGGRPILLRVYEDQGHGVAGLQASSSRDADRLAFCAAAVGLEIT